MAPTISGDIEKIFDLILEKFQNVFLLEKVHFAILVATIICGYPIGWARN